jgi:hypothetical protein
MFEDLFTNIFSNFIASGFWKTIDYFIESKYMIKDILENRSRELLELLLDISSIWQKKFQSPIYHGNTPLTYIGNGKFGDHL